MRRTLLIALVGVVLLLLLADRIGVIAAQSDVARRLEADVNVRSTPAVTIHGFPFLTQLLSGDYDDVDVVLRGLDADGVRVERLSVHLSGAHVSLPEVLRQNRSQIQVDHATARLLLTYADIDAFIARQTGVHLPHRLTRAVVGAVAVAGSRVVLDTAFGSVPVALRGLPFGIRLTSAQSTRAGVVVTGAASGLQIKG